MSGDDDQSYDNTNRAFLQAFIARSTFTLEEAKPVLAAIFTAHEKREILPGDVTEADFRAYVKAANDAISPFDLEIRSIMHQTSKKTVHALVNSTSDPITQLATTYTPDEIAFLKRVLDFMFETNNTQRREVMAITPIQAVQLHKPTENRRDTQEGAATQGGAAQAITMTQAEKMMKALVEQGWFEKSKKEYFSLSPRAIMELRGWLMQTYNDAGDEDGDEDLVMRIKLCSACKQIITVGQRCPKRTCACRLHDMCTAGFFRMQKSQKCPDCKTEWTGEDFVGERAAPSSSQRKQRKSGNTRTISQAVEVAIEEDGAEDDDE